MYQYNHVGKQRADFGHIIIVDEQNFISTIYVLYGRLGEIGCRSEWYCYTYHLQIFCRQVNSLGPQSQMEMSCLEPSGTLHMCDVLI